MKKKYKNKILKKKKKKTRQFLFKKNVIKPIKKSLALLALIKKNYQIFKKE